MTSTVAFYEEHADSLSERYDRVTFEAVHCHLLGYLPPLPAAVLDIGSGSGRDAIAMARRGYSVTAVEPSRAMRSRAQTRAGTLPIKWVADSLPHLRHLDGTGAAFAFILCSAVIMHVAPDELGDALRSIGRLLVPGGHLGLTMRNALPTDARGTFQTYSNAEIVVAGELAGLSVVRSEADRDQLGRRDLVWRTIVFVK